MNFAFNWIIDSATAGTFLAAGGLLVMAMLRGPGFKQRWGEAVMAACIIGALIALIPGRPQFSLSLIHLNGSSPATGLIQNRLHIGPLPSGKAALPSSLPTPRSSAVHHSASLAASLACRLAGGLGLWWLPIIYLCGVVFMLARVAIGHWLLWRLRATARPAPASAQEHWNELLGRKPVATWGRRPRLLVAPNIRSPVTFGIWRPVVLIPPALCQKCHSLELQAVLLHEIAHIHRQDALTDLVAVVAGVLFFYQPLLWWLRRKVRLYREYVADQQAALGMASPGGYATCLLELARSGGPLLVWPGPATPLLGSHSEFYQRMKQLLRHPPVATPETRFPLRWLISAAIVMAMAATTLTLRAGAGVPLWPQRSLATIATPHANATGAIRLRQRPTFSPATAVARGTAYLLRHQGANGQWLGRYGPAVTALVVKALVAGGHSLSARPVSMALTYIESCRHADGGFYTNMEPIYNTAIVIRTLASLPTRRFGRQIESGLHFLKSTQAAAARPRSVDRWFKRSRFHSAMDAALTVEALRSAGRPAGDAGVQQALAMLRHKASWINQSLDPQERSADDILQNYGLLTYAQLKSMIYAGLSRNDPRVQRLVRWIGSHYTLRVNPASHNSRGRYYYYLTFAKALRAYGSATITDSTGVRHHWRRELYQQLASTEQANGSWVNHHSSDYLEGNPTMATTYAVLALEQLEKPLP